MKKIITYLLLIFSVSVFLTACKEDDIDDIYPVIDMNVMNAFPKNCDTLYIGESFDFRVLFTDNKELGSYSIDIHNNFDHHSHTTEFEECDMDPVKDPLNPFLFIQEYSIPDGVKEYNASNVINVPNDVDTGDYHIMIRLTDKEGWQTIMGFGVKIVEKD